VTELRHGVLASPGDHPSEGEQFHQLVSQQGVVIEQIQSAASNDPTNYIQDHDEWVVVLAGSAVLDVGGERYELAAGDWLLLPAHVPHSVEHTAAGTNWLAVHLPPADPGHSRDR
jgi:quercetin dioxygenase-like cupin family protein